MATSNTGTQGLRKYDGGTFITYRGKAWVRVIWKQHLSKAHFWICETGKLFVKMQMHIVHKA